MGILSDLFGAGKRRDEAQDRHIEELMSRVLTLEQSPGGGVGQPALDALAETVDAQRAVIAELTGQIATLTERQAIDDVARAAAAGASAATHALHERISELEDELADVRAFVAANPTQGEGEGGGDAGEGITLPEIK